MSSRRIDLTTAECIESAYAHAAPRLRKQISQTGFLKVWKAVGKAIGVSMRDKNGVNVPGFGTFSFRANGQPCFILADSFARLSRAEQFKPPVPGKTVAHKLALSRVAKDAACAKHVAGSVVDCVARHCASLVNKGRGNSVRISFHPVAELTFRSMKLSVNFVTDFLSYLGKVPLTTAHLTRHTARHASRPRSGRSRNDPGTPRQITEFARGVAEAAALAPSEIDRASSVASTSSGIAHNIIARIKESILRRAGSDGIQAVSRVLKIMDDSGDRRLSRSELKYGLRDFGIDLSASQMDRVMSYFDRNGDGTVSFDEFLRGLAPPLSAHRLKFVHQAFDVLDKSGDGVVTVEDLKMAYDASWHPDVKEGTADPDKVLQKFLDQFEGGNGNGDGMVTIEEFEDYYTNLSASIDDDDYFELMMRNAWHIAGGEGAAANTTNRRVLVTHGDGQQSVETVNNDLGLKNNKAGRKEMARRLREEQGIDDMVGGVDVFGTAGDVNVRPNSRKVRSREQTNLRKTAVPDHEKSAQPRPKSNRNRKEQNYVRAPSSRGLGRAPGSQMGIPPAPPTPSPKAGETAWAVLRRILFTPPVPLPAMQQKLEMCVAMGTDIMLESTFGSKLAGLHRKEQARRKKNGIPLAAPLSRSELRRVVAAASAVGGSVGYIDLSKVHAELIRCFGTKGSRTQSATGGCGHVGKSQSVVDRVRKKIVSTNGPAGIHDLMRVLRVMDVNGDDSLSRDELKAGLLDLGIEVSLSDMENLMVYFDTDHNGTISFAEFCDGIRGKLTATRANLVDEIFDSLEDPIGSGKTSIAIIEEELQSGGSGNHANTVLDEMEEMIRDAGTDEVSYDIFVDFYRSVSAAIDGDWKFEQMLRKTWPSLATPIEKQTVASVRSRSARSRDSATQGTSRSKNTRGSGRRRSSLDENDPLAAYRKENKRPDLVNRERLLRLKAAAHVQAVFRGHKGRKKSSYERKKHISKISKEKEDEAERKRNTQRIRRTQPKHNPIFRSARR